MGYGDGFIYRRGRIWWMSLNTPEGRLRESTGTDNELLAEAVLSRRSQPFRKKRIRVSDSVKYLLCDYKANNKRSLPDVVRTLEKHVLPALGDCPVQDITYERIEDYKLARITAGASAATVNRELSILRRSHDLTRRRHPELLLLPLMAEALREDNVRQGFVPTGRFERLYDALPKHAAPVALCCYYWGCRRSELLGDCRTERRKEPLRWENVDIEGRKPAVFLTRTKNDQPREVPIYNKQLMAVFEAARDANARRDTQSPYVFTRRGRPFWEFRNAWKKATEQAGLPGLRLHDLRRTAIRNMVRAGIPAAVAMLVTGHKTRSAFERYNIVDSTELDLVGDRMAAFFQTETAHDKKAEDEEVGEEGGGVH